MKKEQLTKILIDNNNNIVIIDRLSVFLKLIKNNTNIVIAKKLADLLLGLKGKSFQDFNEAVKDFFWEIQNDHNIFKNEESASNYFDKNFIDYLENDKLQSIINFWGVKNITDLSPKQMASYILGNLEKNNFKKINQDIFNFINQ
jgi:hypothetical protein